MFSKIEYSPSNLQTPRIPCTQQQIDLINSTCTAMHCQQFYAISATAFAICAATYCPDDFDQVLYSECVSCVALYAGLQSTLSMVSPVYTLDIDGAAQFCLNPPDLSAFGSVDFASYLYNITDGIVIASKPEYPIKNTWHFAVPSWITVERGLYIAEIDVCADTDPDGYNSDCDDSNIIGCTHLEATAFIEDTNIIQTVPLTEDEPDITSHIGLNRLQTQFIVDNVFNDDILKTLDFDGDDAQVFGVF